MKNIIFNQRFIKSSRISIFLTLILSLGGCVTTSGRSTLAEEANFGLRKPVSDSTEAPRLSEKQLSGVENIKFDQSIGFIPPYTPVIQPAEVKKVWVPAHTSEKEPDILVAGHWVYIKIREDSWFIDSESPDEADFAVIIPSQGETE